MANAVARRALLALVALSLAVMAQRAAAEFTPITGWDNQLFPSYLVTTATMRSAEEDGESSGEIERLGDTHGVLGVRIESPGEGTQITVTISADAILEPSTFEGTLGDEGTTCDIFPRIRYKYATLAKNKQSVPVAVTYRVELGGEDEEDVDEQTATITLRSVNDCPFTIYGGDTQTDVSYVFAGYVNEQHPFVDKVLREALDRGIVDSFTGYQSNDAAEVYRQVYALWDALSERDVRYSNITTSAAENQVISSQHVRLIDESINNAQANCVDGSVLFASLLRKIDIEPVLVFLPTHCYLGFYLDPEGKQLVGLETTLIGSVADGDATREIPGVKNVVDEKRQQTNSWATFCAAIEMGNDDLEENAERFNKDDPGYQTISIAKARGLGILPIAFDSNDVFQPVSAEDE
jgi:hypothetical protein